MMCYICDAPAVALYPLWNRPHAVCRHCMGLLGSATQSASIALDRGLWPSAELAAVDLDILSSRCTRPELASHLLLLAEYFADLATCVLPGLHTYRPACITDEGGKQW